MADVDARGGAPTGERRPRGRWGIALAVSAALAAALVVPAWWRMSSQPPPGYARGAGDYVIRMTDYDFAPGRMVWRVGDRVTLILLNESQGHPGRNHEFMMGRRPNRERTPFGATYTGGFAEDFFAGGTDRPGRGQAVRDERGRTDGRHGHGRLAVAVAGDDGHARHGTVTVAGDDGHDGHGTVTVARDDGDDGHDARAR
jgi:hypothetical protein